MEMASTIRAYNAEGGDKPPTRAWGPVRFDNLYWETVGRSELQINLRVLYLSSICICKEMQKCGIPAKGLRPQITRLCPGPYRGSLQTPKYPTQYLIPSPNLGCLDKTQRGLTQNEVMWPNYIVLAKSCFCCFIILWVWCTAIRGNGSRSSN